MKIIIWTVVLLFSISMCFSQNYIYKGDDKFESTNTWEFEMKTTYWSGNPELTVGKKEDGSGYLLISIAVPFKSTYIGETLLVFLEDGTVIKCIDKGIRDHVDDQSMVIYNFTKDEINSLKLKKIAKIRFSILGGYQGKETFTADNKKPFFMSLNKEEKSFYETNTEIAELFKK